MWTEPIDLLIGYGAAWTGSFRRSVEAVGRQVFAGVQIASRRLNLFQNQPARSAAGLSPVPVLASVVKTHSLPTRHYGPGQFLKGLFAWRCTA